MWNINQPILSELLMHCTHKAILNQCLYEVLVMFVFISKQLKTAVCKEVFHTDI